MARCSILLSFSSLTGCSTATPASAHQYATIISPVNCENDPSQTARVCTRLICTQLGPIQGEATAGDCRIGKILQAAWCLQGFATTVNYAATLHNLFSLSPRWAKTCFGIAFINLLLYVVPNLFLVCCHTKDVLNSTGGIYIHIAKVVFVRLFQHSEHIHSHTVHFAVFRLRRYRRGPCHRSANLFVSYWHRGCTVCVVMYWILLAV